MKSTIDRLAAEVPDHAVDNLPAIRAIKESLERVITEQAAAVSAVKESDRQIAEFRAMAAPYEQQIREIEETQATIAIDCVLGDAQAQQTWREADQAIEDARRFLRQHRLAMAPFEARAKQPPSRVASLASQKHQLQMDLAEAIWNAKLEKARE